MDHQDGSYDLTQSRQNRPLVNDVSSQNNVNFFEVVRVELRPVQLPDCDVTNFVILLYLLLIFHFGFLRFLKKCCRTMTRTFLHLFVTVLVLVFFSGCWEVDFHVVHQKIQNLYKNRWQVLLHNNPKYTNSLSHPHTTINTHTILILQFFTLVVGNNYLVVAISDDVFTHLQGFEKTNPEHANSGPKLKDSFSLKRS